MVEAFPRTLGRYRVDRLIARGGMAEIYAGDDPETGRVVCLKRVRPEFSDDPDFAGMFRQEARIASAIEHDNVVRIFEVGEHEGALFLAMELVDGLDLRHLLKASRAIRLRLPVEFAFHVAKGLLAALAAASHVRAPGIDGPIVHRDVSPHNILIGRDGAVKLTDFGIAKAKGATTVTQTGVIKGKLAYLAPEQAGGGQVTPVTDLFCAGLVLYELLVGKRFHQGHSDSELIASVFKPREPRIPWLSDDINQFLAALLRKDPDQRFASAEAALRALEQLDVPIFDASDAAILVDRLGAVDQGLTRTQIAVPSALRAAPDAEDDSDASALLEGRVSLPTVAAPAAVPDAAAAPRRDARPWMRLDKRARVAVAAAAVALFAAVGVGVATSSGAGAAQGADTPQWTMAGADTAASSPSTGTGAPAGADDLVVRIAPVSGSDSGAATHQRTDPVSEKRSHTSPEEATTEVARAPAAEKADTGAQEREGESQDTDAAAGSGSMAPGLLRVFVRPWAKVWVDGAYVGVTPIRAHKLRPGKHRVVVVNEAAGFRKTRYVTIAPGESSTVSYAIARQR